MAPTEPEDSASSPARPAPGAAHFDVPKGPDAPRGPSEDPTPTSALPPRSSRADDDDDGGSIPGVTPTTGRIVQRREKPDERGESYEYDRHDDEQPRPSAPRLAWVLATIGFIVGVLVLVDLATGGGGEGPKLVQSDLDGRPNVEQVGDPDKAVDSVQEPAETDDRTSAFIPAEPTPASDFSGGETSSDGAGDVGESGSNTDGTDGTDDAGSANDRADDSADDDSGDDDSADGDSADDDSTFETPPTPEPAPTEAPPAPPTAVPAEAGRTDVFGRTCDVNYSGCVPVASDVDCFNDEADGPAFVYEPVQVVGADIYGLDIDGDGVGCNVAGVGAAVYLGSGQG